MMCGEGRTGFTSVKVRGLKIEDERDRRVSGPKETIQISKKNHPMQQEGTREPNTVSTKYNSRSVFTS
jgi:hypothetical protein